jgi:hypothetical protein
MKKIIITLGILILATTVKAADTGTVTAADTGLVNFSDFFAHARAGYSVDQHHMRSTVLYSAIQRFHSIDGMEYANVNAGYDTTNKHPIFMVGVRADNLIPLIWGGNWGKAHVTTAALPTIEFGPYVSSWPALEDSKVVSIGFSYGLVLAIGFDK